MWTEEPVWKIWQISSSCWHSLKNSIADLVKILTGQGREIGAELENLGQKFELWGSSLKFWGRHWKSMYHARVAISCPTVSCPILGQEISCPKYLDSPLGTFCILDIDGVGPGDWGRILKFGAEIWTLGQFFELLGQALKEHVWCNSANQLSHCKLSHFRARVGLPQISRQSHWHIFAYWRKKALHRKTSASLTFAGTTSSSVTF